MIVALLFFPSPRMLKRPFALFPKKALCQGLIRGTKMQNYMLFAKSVYLWTKTQLVLNITSHVYNLYNTEYSSMYWPLSFQLKNIPQSNYIYLLLKLSCASEFSYLLQCAKKIMRIDVFCTARKVFGRHKSYERASNKQSKLSILPD